MSIGPTFPDRSIDNMANRIFEKLRDLPTVDHDGHEVATTSVDPPTAGPTSRDPLELALFEVAQQHGVNPLALLDSRAFLAKLADIEQSDGQALSDAVASALAANPRLAIPAPTTTGMKSNPAQAGGAPATSPTQGTSPAERIRSLAGQHLDEPLPSGYAPVVN